VVKINSKNRISWIESAETMFKENMPADRYKSYLDEIWDNQDKPICPYFYVGMCIIKEKKEVQDMVCNIYYPEIVWGPCNPETCMLYPVFKIYSDLIQNEPETFKTILKRLTK